MRFSALILAGLMAFVSTAPVMAKEFNKPKGLTANNQMLINQAKIKARLGGAGAAADANSEAAAATTGSVVPAAGDVRRNIILNEECGDQNVGVIKDGARAPRNQVIAVDSIINICR